MYGNVVDTEFNAHGIGIEFILQHLGSCHNNYIANASYGITCGVSGICKEMCGGNGYAQRDVVIKNNILYNIKKGVIYIVADGTNHNNNKKNVVDGVEIYNNTLVGGNKPGYGMVHLRQRDGSGASDQTTGEMRNVSVKNNICMNAPDFAGTTTFRNDDHVSNIIIDHNLFWGCGTNAWSDGRDTNTVVADPRFVGGNKPTPYFKLKDGSPAINAGIDVGLPFKGSAPDMGAYESRSTTPTPTQKHNVIFAIPVGSKLSIDGGRI